MQIVWISGGSKSSYEWDVPDISAHECLVRVSGIRTGNKPDISDTSNDIFSITSGGAPGEPQRLRAHWQLDETEGVVAFDSSGNENHGALFGNPTWLPSAGMLGGAPAFDGVNDYVDCGADPIFDITDRITVAAWINVDSVPGNYTPIVAKGNTAWRLSTSIGSRKNKLHFAVCGPPWENFVDGSTEPSLGEWHHVCGTYDGQEIRLYIDGVIDAAQVSTEPIPVNTHKVYIGKNQETPGHHWDGLIDDVRIYDYALSYAEIRELFFGLVGHWKLDETEGVIAFDSSGNGNHGTLHGNPQWQSSAGPIDGALSFDGSDDYVEIPIGSLISQMSDFTFMAWVCYSDKTGSWQRVFDFGTSDTEGYMFLCPQVNQHTHEMRFAITAGDGSGEQMMSATALLSDWHHVAVTIDADNQFMALYLDGEAVAGETLTLTPSDLGVTTQNWLGRSQYAPDAYYDGLLDDVRIYNQALGDDAVFEVFTGQVMVVEAPNVVGMAQAAAESVITALGLAPGMVSSMYSDTVPAGSVISQNPTPGTELPGAAKVHLVLSLGPEEKPADLQACCFAEGFCLDITPEQCMILGGIPQGEGTSCASSDCASPPAAGLVAHWKLDETEGVIAFDSSGNGSHGTLHGNPQWQPSAGPIDGALSFDGSDDYVEIPIGSLISQMSDFTFTAWVCLSDGGGPWQRVFDFGTSDTQGYMFLCPQVDRHTNEMRFAITAGDGSGEQMMSTTALASDWHHVAVTIDADNQFMALYLDGEAVAGEMLTLTPSDLGVTTQNWLGRSQYAWDAYYDGLLDDVRIYSQALKPGEIAELAQ